MKEDVVSLTESLIRFPSMHSRPDEIRRCIEYIGTVVESAGLESRCIDINGVPSMMVMPEAQRAPVLLMSHVDVVDADDSLFEPRIADGNLYGRGSIDDKYAAALSLVLMMDHFGRIREQGGRQRDLTFGILITGDEEVGGHNGARPILQQIDTDFCIALDGGSLDKIVTKEKGVLVLELIARGQSAHGARPWMGDNAIEKLIADIHTLKSFFSASTTGHWHRTMNVSVFQAGSSHNQVPDTATAVVDIRFTEDDDVDRLLDDWRKRLQSELIVKLHEPMFHAAASPYLDALLSAAPDAVTGFAHGASDARFLSEVNIPGVVWGADGDKSQHSEAEHVNIDSIYRLYDLLDRFLTGITEDDAGRFDVGHQG